MSCENSSMTTDATRLRHVPPWFIHVRSIVHIARASTGANRGETTGGTCARGSHGYTTRRPSTTNLHEVSYGLQMPNLIAVRSHSIRYISSGNCYIRCDQHCCESIAEHGRDVSAEIRFEYFDYSE
jgi:hypothetical protein